MLKRRLFIVSLVLMCGVLIGVLPEAGDTSRPAKVPVAAAAQEASGSPVAAREAAYRANNLGVALLEQFKHREGAEQFERALKLDPRLALARVNLAIALYNVPDADAAAREAASALALAPGSPQALYILALIARSRNQADESIAYFQRVLQRDERDTGANINLGQLHAQARDYPAAIKSFRAALASEPYNTTALYGLATVLLRSDQREEGQRLLQQFQSLRQSGAGTSLGTNYLEQGRYAEAVTSTGAEAGLVDRNTPAVIFNDATASILPAAETTRRRAAPSNDEAYLKRRQGRMLFGGGAAVFDFDGDGDLDLFDIAPGGQKLYRNDGGTFVDVTNRSGALQAARFGGAVGGVVAGDYDNDARPDLLVLSYNRIALYRNEGAGRFTDTTVYAGLAPYPALSISAAFLDYDHDGDLDIFIAGYIEVVFRNASFQVSKKSGEADAGISGAALKPVPNRLLRNNGNGKFTDLTAASKLAGAGNVVAVVPTDYDNRRDVDLLVVNLDAAPALYRNMRDGTFRDVAGEVGLDIKGRFTSAAAGDVNKDGYTDFLFGAAESAGVFALSDGQGRFKIANAPVETRDITAAQFLDYDNDGLLDLLATTTTGARIWRNVGDGWTDASERAFAPAFRLMRSTTPTFEDARLWASGDLDADGDTDLILHDATGRLRLARNDDGGEASRNRSLRVRLAGRVSNRSGVESKVEMRAGSLWQKLEVYAATPQPAPADLVFGLGRRETADAVRVIWPSGTVQSETELSTTTTAGVLDEKGSGGTAPGLKRASVNSGLTVTELDRKPSSCPYLFAWNGERFEFITDFMGGGELGYWLAPSVRAQADPDEYVRIRGDQLKPRDGRYELRVTNELEEVLFMDKLQLVAVAHPEGTEVFPGEGLGSPLAVKFQLFTTRDARAPARAIDEHGHDVRPHIAQLDRRYPDDFPLESIRGYAGEHTLTLELGEAKSPEGKTRKKSAKEAGLLLLTGWTDYAFSSDNVAAAHRGMSLKPPALQVKDARGRWRTVIEDIGIPIGRPQTIVVDLKGKFLSSSRAVRIVTNMRIYWDQILVERTAGRVSQLELKRLDSLQADLSWRGFSAQGSPDGREPFGYDYARVSPVSPWKVFTGRYTREGDVRELLEEADDMFVISRPGDELSLAFDASLLPPLARGWKRTFLLYADGYSKEMDINSASPEEVAPLPFHRMNEYPYRWPATYPQTPAHLDYLERYNTRVVAAPIPRIAMSDK